MSDLKISWQTILRDAITRPGAIHEAYSRFHSYSIGNQLLALMHCNARSIQPGPIATFPRWKELGRYVRKGEKALTLCMPVSCKAKHPARDQHGQEAEQEIAFTRFVYRNHWFVLAQTEEADYQPEPLPDWDESRAPGALAIERTAFDELDGNLQGFASGRKVAINLLAAMPAKTLFHELAHVVLGHTAEGNLNDGSERTPRSLREVEAECVALLCCESLGLPGVLLSSQCYAFSQPVSFLNALSSASIIGSVSHPAGDRPSHSIW